MARSWDENGMKLGFHCKVMGQSTEIHYQWRFLARKINCLGDDFRIFTMGNALPGESIGNIYIYRYIYIYIISIHLFIFIYIYTYAKVFFWVEILKQIQDKDMV